MFGLTLVAGLVGALVAWLIGWTFRKNSASRIARNLRPWHVGAAVALADIIAVAAVAAVAA